MILEELFALQLPWLEGYLPHTLSVEPLESLLGTVPNSLQ